MQLLLRLWCRQKSKTELIFTFFLLISVTMFPRTRNLTHPHTMASCQIAYQFREEALNELDTLT